MISYEILDVTSSSLQESTKQLTLLGRGALLSGEETDSRAITLDYFGQLGVTARPYDADGEGCAQALAVDGHCIGLRDTRIGEIYGKLSPGDTALHSTDPTQSVRLLLKGETRQAALVVSNERGDSIFSMAAETILLANGSTLKFAEDGSFSLLSKFGSGIIADASGVWIKGGSVKLGANPSAPLFAPVMLTPPMSNGGGPIPPTPLPTWQPCSSIFITTP